MAYATAEEATTYFGARLYADAWATASASDQTKALAMASAAIDRQPLLGIRTEDDQAAEFPRYPDTEIPQAVKDACCEEALALLERGNNQRRKLQAEGVASFTIGSLSETFVTGARGSGLLSPEARALLRPWLAGAVSII